MSKPWIRVDDIDLNLLSIICEFEAQLEKEISSTIKKNKKITNYYKNLANKTNFIILNNPIRKFGTTSLKKKYNNEIESNDNFVDFINLTESESDKKIIKNFKKVFGGGYLGYKHVHHFGSVIYDSTVHLTYRILDLENKIINYLSEIPDEVVY